MLPAMNSRICLLLLVLVFVSVPAQAKAAEPEKSRSAMFSDSAFAHEQYAFSPYDTIYIVVDLLEVPPGEHTVAFDWKTPSGELERQTLYNFTIEDPKPAFRVYAWLRLWEKGPLERTFTGQDFSEKFYGKWNVQIYLDNILLEERSFQVQ
jgi:hypothetical protein